MSIEKDIIDPQTAGSLAGLFSERVQRSGSALAYQFYNQKKQLWDDLSWTQMEQQISRWQSAFINEGLQAGDRVAIILRNCPEWVMFDIAAAGLGLVTVPLYTQDRPENIAYILQDAGVKVLLIEHQECWDRLETVHGQLDSVQRILTLEVVNSHVPEPRLMAISDWLPHEVSDCQVIEIDPNTLATIVYTSGTTGRSKGVMLSHYNILWNAHRSLRLDPAYPDDLFLSFLPLSHTLERTAGYYLPMMSGAAIAYNRSIPELSEDLQIISPTVLMSVPRIFERVYNKIQAGLQEKSILSRFLFQQAVECGWQKFEIEQGRASWSPRMMFQPLLHKLVGAKVMAKLGGHMRLAIVGGAPLSPSIAKVFIGLGLPIMQGYGLTETSPVISVNTLKKNDPAGVGQLLDDIEINIGDDEELLTRSPGVMLGYWGNPEATAEIIRDGWLHTGDKARYSDGNLYITGRIKEILVLANGEKIPPADMELAITMDGLFEQVMVVGDNRPYLSAMVVFNADQWLGLAHSLGLDPNDSSATESSLLKDTILQRIATQLSAFPGYAQVREVHCQTGLWTVDDGLITPTMKLRRNRLLQAFEEEVDGMYEEHK